MGWLRRAEHFRLCDLPSTLTHPLGTPTPEVIPTTFTPYLVASERVCYCEAWGSTNCEAEGERVCTESEREVSDEILSLMCE